MERDYKVCCCKYYENGDLMMQALHKIYPDVPVTINKFIEILASKCNPNRYLGSCEYCQDPLNLIREKIPNCIEIESFKFYQFTAGKKLNFFIQ